MYSLLSQLTKCRKKRGRNYNEKIGGTLHDATDQTLMPAQLQFSNVDDGIDWERMLPPHIVAANAPPPRIPQSDRTMVFDWPLPEDHPSLQQRAPRRSTQARQAPEQQSRNLPRTSVVRERPSFISRREMVMARDQQLYDNWNGIERSERSDTVARSRNERVLEATRQAPSTRGSRVSSRSTTAAELADAQRREEQREQALLEEIFRTGENTNVVEPAPVLPPPVVRTAPLIAPPSRPRQDDQWELRDFSYETLLELGSMAVSTGLDKKQLARMRPVQYRGCKFKPSPTTPQPTPNTSSRHKPSTPTPRGSDSIQPSDAECTICIEAVRLGDLCIELPCGHVFHPPCILQWLARTNRCPTCRFEIVRRN